MKKPKPTRSVSASNATSHLSRREFLADAAAATAAVSLAACFPDVGGRWAEQCAGNGDSGALAPAAGSSRVVEVRDDTSVADDGVNTINPTAVAAMLADGLDRLTDAAARPWSALLPGFTVGTRIGIKVNCLNQHCPTSVPLVRAVIDSLKAELGITATDIVVWDRRLDELTACGFSADSVGAQVVGTHNSTSDKSGPGYATCFFPMPGGKTTRVSRILTELTDLTINCPVLKTHEVSAVTGAMKNTYGMIDNPGDFHADLNNVLPALYALEPIRTRVRLAVVDALVAVTVGGTASPKDSVPRRLLLGRDPIATDARAVDLVNQIRTEKNLGLPNMDPARLAWLDRGAELGLGTRAYELVSVVR